MNKSQVYIVESYC